MSVKQSSCMLKVSLMIYIFQKVGWNSYFTIDIIQRRPLYFAKTNTSMRKWKRVKKIVIENRITLQQHQVHNSLWKNCFIDFSACLLIKSTDWLMRKPPRGCLFQTAPHQWQSQDSNSGYLILELTFTIKYLKKNKQKGNNGKMERAEVSSFSNKVRGWTSWWRNQCWEDDEGNIQFHFSEYPLYPSLFIEYQIFSRHNANCWRRYKKSTFDFISFHGIFQWLPNGEKKSESLVWHEGPSRSTNSALTAYSQDILK